MELSKMTPEEIEANYRLWNGDSFTVISNDNGNVKIETKGIIMTVRFDTFNYCGYKLIPKNDFSEIKTGDPVFVWDRDQWDYKCRIFIKERNGYAICMEDVNNEKYRFCEKITDFKDFLDD